MAVKIFSCMVSGIRGTLVEVEADILQGMPSFKIVGLGDTAVQESKERIRSAIKNSGAVYPQQKKVINLAPANQHKAGPQFDLPIALGILAASGKIPVAAEVIFLGELALSGGLKPVKGIISAAIFAKEAGFKEMLIPKENAAEASLIEGVRIFAADSLSEVMAHLRGETQIAPYENNPSRFFSCGETDREIAEIIGQEKGKRALQIAAAGHHHLLFSGPAGVGKTLLARALPSILPPLKLEEAIKVMQIHSVKEINNKPEAGFALTRPFREIHQSATITSLTGGGNPPMPGEISLAHEGALFMDEIAEFPRAHIESLRKPMEEGRIVLSRNTRTVEYPAKIILIAAMNPCPCGHFGDPLKKCECRPHQIMNYSKKLSGPILDRIDLFVEVQRQNLGKAQEQNYGKMQRQNLAEVQRQNLGKTNYSEAQSSARIRETVMNARKIQEQRFKNLSILTNSQMGSREINKFCVLPPSAKNLLDHAAEKYALSGREYHKTIKVARTIADLGQKTHIAEEHIAEALQYRPVKHYNASV